MPRIPIADLHLEVERFGAGPPILLIMGVGAQLIMWPDGFCEALAAEGFEVIRFDNRDIGLSTRLSHLPVPQLPKLIMRRQLGLSVKAPYTLSDMATDTAQLLEALGHERAHIVGCSMGGMIAQHLAIEHPQRVQSLTSLMSTTGKRSVGQPKPKAIQALVGNAPTDRESCARYVLRLHQVTGSTTGRDPDERYLELGRRIWDRGTHPQGFIRQMAAILASGDRTRKLRGVSAPTLVLHGREDPLVPLSGGKATAAAIPRARLRVFEGMGHDLPSSRWGELVGEIAEHARRYG